MPRLIHQDPKDKTAFGTNLKKVRLYRKLTQKAMAGTLESSVSNVGSYEELRAQPPVKKQFEIADKLEIHNKIAFLTDPQWDPANDVTVKSQIEELYLQLKADRRAQVDLILGIK